MQTEKMKENPETKQHEKNKKTKQTSATSAKKSETSNRPESCKSAGRYLQNGTSNAREK